jgi:hypothetical protein
VDDLIGADDGTTAAESTTEHQDWTDDAPAGDDDLSNLRLFDRGDNAAAEGGADEAPPAADDDQPAEPAEPQFTIKVNGEERQVTQEQLVALAQQGDDYTRKTQALSEERQRFAAYEALERALEHNPAEALRLLAETYNVTPDAGTPDGDDDAFVDPLEREVAELRHWRDQQEEVARQAAVERELATLKDTYGDPDLNEVALLQYAVDNGIPTLDVAYKAMTWEARRQAASDQKVDQKRHLPPVEGGAKRPKAAVAPGGSAKPSLREAFRMAVGT